MLCGMPRPLLLLAVLGALFVPAAPAAAATVLSQDAQGRTIRFDVQAPEVDVEWYAGVLRGALHGEEIERVRVRIVEPSAIRRTCGAGALACYGGFRGSGTIVVAAGRSASLAATLLHEYGHHVDESYSVPGVPEPNGTPGWWAARGMAALVEAGEVALDYSSGWDRSIGEIFAEDYTQVHMAARYAIRWLEPPVQSVKDAIVADLGGSAPTVDPGDVPETDGPQATPRTAVFTAGGSLTRGRAQALPFGLLGPGRRVELTVRSRTARSRLRFEIVCDGALVARRTVTGTRTAKIDRGDLGPADCEAILRNTGTRTVRYVVTLRLTRPEA
jgi:hypothetical protein